MHKVALCTACAHFHAAIDKLVKETLIAHPNEQCPLLKWMHSAVFRFEAMTSEVDSDPILQSCPAADDANANHANATKRKTSKL